MPVVPVVVAPVIGVAGPQGSWVGPSSSGGYVLGGWNSSSDLMSLAGSVALDRGARWRWSAGTTDARAPQSPDQATRRAATWYDANQVSLRVTLTNAFNGNLNLYALDWDSTARRQVVTVSDGSMTWQSALTDSFNDGAWMTFPVNVPAGGTITITADRTGGHNAVLSVITFGASSGPPVDPTPSPPATAAELAAAIARIAALEQRTVPGVFSANRYGLVAGGDPTANTAALQATFDAATTYCTTARAGARIVIPPGAYTMNGGVTINTTNRVEGLEVVAHGAALYMETGNPNVSMFRTTVASFTEANNGRRNQWSWSGGQYIGTREAGSKAFEFNAVHRLVLERVYVGSWEEGIRTRFCLHAQINDSRVQDCTAFGIRAGFEPGDWAGGTVSNSAGHVAVFRNVRFYGHGSQTAQLRVSHIYHRVIDCTFEGSGPAQFNYEFINSNTSTLTSEFYGGHMENDPGIAHVHINTQARDYGIVDFSSCVHNNVPRIWVEKGKTITVGRMGYPSTPSTYTSLPWFKTTAAAEGGSQQCFWFFTPQSGFNGVMDVTNPYLWSDGQVGIASHSWGANGAYAAVIPATLPFNGGGTVNKLGVDSAGNLTINGTIVGTQTA